MSQNLTISDTGLKLIKAFEGFRPVDRELITGQRVVGYGHRLYSDDAVMMDKGEAEAILRSDLEPFEDMINSEVHAPMTQSQFDALCSFAFNIGPKAFLQSDTLRAINNGRPLDAANSLDIWRKSEINGQIYVVDALMRRRTAEKALFLRTERSVPAGRENLPPLKDTTLAGLSTDDGLPVFTEEDANGMVVLAPYAAAITPLRRREDGPAGALQLSELDIIDDEDDLDITDENQIEAVADSAEDGLGLDLDLDLDLDLGMDDSDSVETSEYIEDPDQDAETRKSPIAAAATDIVARLDALIDSADARFDGAEEELLFGDDEGEADIPTSEDVFEDEAQATLIELNKGETLASRIMKERVGRKEEVPTDAALPKAEKDKPVKVIDELAQDDAFRIRTDSAAKYIEQTQPAIVETDAKSQSGLGLWIPVLLGFILVGLAGGTLMSGSENIFGDWGSIIAFTGFVIGLGLILAGVYATLRMNLLR